MTEPGYAEQLFDEKIQRLREERRKQPSEIIVEEESLTSREQVLYEAADLVTGDRNQAYGSPTQNFQNTADIWNVLLGHKLKDGEVITATEVATLMIGLKLARTVAQPKRDNFVDMAGYAACGWETQEETL